MKWIVFALVQLFALFAGAKFGTIPCPTGWSCRVLPDNKGVEMTSEGLTVVYSSRLMVSVTCEGARDADLPDALLSNFTFPHNVTYFMFSKCPLPVNNTFASVLSDRTVLTLRVDPQRELNEGLTPRSFRNLTSLTYLNLYQCMLKSLDKSLFRFTPNLRTLKLTDNRLTQLYPDTFENANKLTNLELGNNFLTKLTDKMAGLTNVQGLYLYHNAIDSVSKEFFSSLPALTTLDFQDNKLRAVSKDLLWDVPNLEKFNLFTNDLLSIPDGFLDNQARLTDISLSDNRKLSTLPLNLLHRSPSLLKFAADRCNLTSLSPSFFDSPALTNLSQLSLSRNKLTTVYQRAFTYLTNLTVLQLNHNLLTEIGQNALSGMKKLRELHVNNNNIRYVHPAAFADQSRLVTLKIGFNQLRSIEESVFEFTTSLENLHLEHNQLVTPASANIPFNVPGSIATIDLSFNQLAALPVSWILEKTLLKMLDLRGNQLTYFDSDECQPTGDSLVIDLSSNNISRVVFDMLVIDRIAEFNAPQEQGPSHSKVILDNNPMICDCYADDLLLYHSNQNDRHYPFNVEMDKLQCASPSIFENQLLLNIPVNDLFCEEERNCPYPCRCLRHAVGDVIEVNCRGLNLTSIPTIGPEKVRLLRMDDNQLSDLRNINASAWTGLTKLTANNNRITSIGVDFPKDLKELWLTGNQLSYLNKSTLDFFNANSSLKQLFLESNPWNCDNCENQNLREFLNANFDRVGNASAILCHGTKKILFQEPICPPEPSLTKNVLIATVFSCLLIAVALAGAAISYYRYNNEIKAWLYAHRMCLWLVKEKELDRNKRFDAFISFSHLDSDFVAKQLIPGLEEQEPFYKLCVHQRDWLAGEWIPNQIHRSVEDSKRTIVVLSKNFIKSVWGQLEFKAAHHQALQDRTNRIIILVYGDLPPASEMDKDLKMYVKFNTYVKWGDDWFWQKLRYAMPHCPVNSSIVPPTFRNLRSPPRHPPSDPNRMVSRLARPS